MQYLYIFILFLQSNIFSSMSHYMILMSFLCKTVLEFDKDCIKSVDCLWQHSHFYNNDPIDSWAWQVFLDLVLPVAEKRQSSTQRWREGFFLNESRKSQSEQVRQCQREGIIGHKRSCQLIGKQNRKDFAESLFSLIRKFIDKNRNEVLQD